MTAQPNGAVTPNATVQKAANMPARVSGRMYAAGWCFDAGAGLGICAYLAIVLRAALGLALGG